MGCFSYLCKKCGKPITSDSLRGENVRLSLLENGKVIEEMQGQYDSYGAVFDKAGMSIEWESKKWEDIVDMHFDINPLNGISAVHVRCVENDPDYKPDSISEDDPGQGWGRMKSFHMCKCEIYHKM
jgi:hypothetical protein